MINLSNKKFNASEVTGLNDIMFRGVMYDHKDILKAIIEICIHEKIDNITLLNSELPKQSFLEMKKKLDVYIESINMLFDVEVSNNYTKSIVNRNLSFGFKVYTDSVNRGSTYEDYKATCVLNIIGGKKNIPRRSYKSYLKNEENKITSEMFIYSEIFVDYYINEYYNKGNQKLIEKYKYIIMLGLNLEQLEEFSRKYGDEIVEKYKKSFKEMLLAKPFEPLFSREEDERRIRESMKKEGLEEGRAEGIEQGMQQKEMELASKMLQADIPAIKVSSITGIPVKKLMTL